jgi:predicted Zn-dependent peptidase
VGPTNAIIIAGGDITADELVPVLEAKLGAWKPKKVQTPEINVQTSLSEKSQIYFVDSPGAAQSILRTLTLIENRTHEDYFNMKMAIQILGGSFMSRVNMNLREDKGYAYGAGCYDVHRYGPSIGMCNTSVQTAVTLPAMNELKKELTEFVGERPGTEKEMSYMKSSLINQFPAKFETTGSLLNEQVMIWRYGLPTDWPERFLPGIENASLDAANQTFADQWSIDRTIWLVVGDKATIWNDLQTFGLEIIEIDTDGQPLGD